MFDPNPFRVSITLLARLDVLEPWGLELAKIKMTALTSLWRWNSQESSHGRRSSSMVLTVCQEQ